ncbi:unnamed protein product [Parnassius apollo]|uniref:(apollo) hypothetical protein n=1 Tax=Parnassius apollo TaxID=110799 RepID=A0A8S3Y4P6_PARAO|nr:unnamed protein product [Parnassius apollo]
MDFDTVKFINEVQKRPSIWNTKCSEYSDRKSKQTAWEELMNVYGAELPTKEKKQLGLNLQKKWRNIRDCFVKAHRAKETKHGSAVKKKNPYIFYDNLLFLKDTVYFKTTSSNVTIVKEDVTKSTENDDTLSSNTSSCVQKRSKKNKNKNRVGRELIGVLNRNLERKNFEDDEDRLFFLSLVKEFKKIPDHMRIQTKLEILRVIKDGQFSEYPEASWDYSKPNTYCGYQKAHYSGSKVLSQGAIGSPMEVHSPSSVDSSES